MNIKSILLGTAAGLMAVSAANAADLPGEPVPAAVDYVKVCDAMGKGYFYIPGSDTCLKLTGRVRFKVQYEYDEAAFSKLSSTADGRVDFLAATATDIGTVTSSFRIKSDNDSITLDKAWISIKNGGTTVTFGKQANLMDGYGGLTSDNGFNVWDATGNGVTVALDGLGGGFFAGVGLYTYANTATILGAGPTVGNSDDTDIELVLGIADQAWGKATLGGFYAFGENSGGAAWGFSTAAAYDYAWGLKAAAELKVTSDVMFEAMAAYGHRDGYDAAINTSFYKLGAGLSYKATPDLTLYGDVSYMSEDLADDKKTLGIAVGATYALAPGLELQTEFEYSDADFDVAADNTTYKAFTRLTRNW